MAIRIEHNIPLSSICTFRMGGNANEVVTLETEADIAAFFSLGSLKKWFMLGGGSNIVFPDGDCETTIVRLAPGEIRIVSEDGDSVSLAAPAGNNWDQFVGYAVDRGLSGIEALSAIPGTVGATPIQNVGAYGSEVKDTIETVKVFDTTEQVFKTFSNEECRFSYRDSVFKHEGKNRYVVTEVVFRLKRAAGEAPRYPGVAEYFAEHGISAPTLADIRTAITAIRAKKLPDPKEIASVGSFFKNPIVEKTLAEKLKAEYPTLAVFPVSDTHSKVGAGSLIDTMGWKGKSFGRISTYKYNALVLVNEGGATRADLESAVAEIISAVKEKYGITLELEPELVSF